MAMKYSVQCVGAPRYRIMVKSSDYITAETILKEAADKAIEVVLEAGGEGDIPKRTRMKMKMKKCDHVVEYTLKDIAPTVRRFRRSIPT